MVVLLNERSHGCSSVMPAHSAARLGPRPLALHLANANLAWRSAHPSELDRFVRGVLAYRRHSYRRSCDSPPAVWQHGQTRLLDYGPPDGWPLLIVPSMVNRSYILDLEAGISLLGHLRRGGMRPLLLDWGGSDSIMRRMTLETLIVERLVGCFDWLRAQSGRRPAVIGYCMGGLLAVALGSMRPADISGLALLATPWDFHAVSCQPRLIPTGATALGGVAGASGGAAIDFLQTMFAMVDPLAVPRKFARFSELDPRSSEARHFVAIEDWLNDGVPLGAEVIQTCLSEWYGDNRPARGAWSIAGRQIAPQTIEIPSFLAIPERDRIVPAASAAALAGQLANVDLVRPASGHVSMVVGPDARRELWQPLLAWLQRIAALQRKNGEA